MPPRRLRLFALTALFAVPLFVPAATPSAKSGEPAVEARAALLVDPATGRVLFQKDIHSPYAPASTVKLLTALIVYENNHGLNGTVQVAKEDTEVEPSHIPLIAGETVSIDTLVHALLIGSDNDAAMTLARYTSGSVPAFVEKMNARAKELGCTGSQFQSPNGLPKDNQYTTAADLLKIFQAAIAIPELRKITSTKDFKLTTQAGTRLLENHNKLLGVYPGMGPAKTGWTEESAHTYAAAVDRNGRELQLIILDSKDKWDDAKALFDYGFARFPSSPSASVSTSVATATAAAETSSPVKASTKSGHTYTVKKGDTLAVISEHEHCTLKALLKANPGIDPTRIKPGQIIALPVQS
jgi:D-alanyl-D-alanine carboxypeptidase